MTKAANFFESTGDGRIAQSLLALSDIPNVGVSQALLEQQANEVQKDHNGTDLRARLCEIAVGLESLGAYDAAYQTFELADQAHPSADVATRLAIFRVAISTGRAQAITNALSRIRLGVSARWHDSFRYVAMRAIELRSQDGNLAARLGRRGDGPELAEARVSSLRYSTRNDLLRTAVDRWIEVESGESLAEANVMAAELAIGAGTLDEAEQYLSAGREVGAELSTLQLISDRLSESVSDLDQLSDYAARSSSLVSAAAKALVANRDPDGEYTLLEKDNSVSPVQKALVRFANDYRMSEKRACRDLWTQTEHFSDDAQSDWRLVLSQQIWKRDEFFDYADLVKLASRDFAGALWASWSAGSDAAEELSELWRYVARDLTGKSKTLALAESERAMRLSSGDPIAFDPPIDPIPLTPDSPGYASAETNYYEPAASLPIAWLNEVLGLGSDSIRHRRLRVEYRDRVMRAWAQLQQLTAQTDENGYQLIRESLSALGVPDLPILMEACDRGAAFSLVPLAELLSDVAASGEIVECKWIKTVAGWLAELGGNLILAQRYLQETIANKPEPSGIEFSQDVDDWLVRESLFRVMRGGGDSKKLGVMLKAHAEKSSGTPKMRALHTYALHQEWELLRDRDAFEALKQINDENPHDLPTLRHLERIAMRQNDTQTLLNILSTRLEGATDPIEVAALLRELEFCDSLLPGNRQATDVALRRFGINAAATHWITRALNRLGRQEQNLDLLLHAYRSEERLYSRNDARTSVALRATMLEAERIGPLAAARKLMTELEGDHPIVAYERAILLLRAQHYGAAAEAFEVAARLAKAIGHRSALWYRAAVVWQDHVSELERALTAFHNVFDTNPGFDDVFERMSKIYHDLHDMEGLATLTERRLRAGGSTPELVDLYLAQAELQEDLRDPAAAQTAIENALKCDPKNAKALRSAATFAMEGHDWKLALERLADLAKATTNNETTLRWALLNQGRILTNELNRAAHGQKIFADIVRRFGDDIEALDLLAQSAVVAQDYPVAIEAIEKLIEQEADQQRRAEERLRLIRTLALATDFEREKRELDALSEDAPLWLPVNRARAAFFARIRSESSRKKHWSQVAERYHKALAKEATVVSHWAGLCEAYDELGHTHRVGHTARVAIALGVSPQSLPSVSEVKLPMHHRHDYVGRGIIKTLAPRGLTPSALIWMNRTQSIVADLVPYQIPAGLEQITDPRAPLLQSALLECVDDEEGTAEVWSSSVEELTFTAVRPSPLVFVVGSELGPKLDEKLRRFLLRKAIVWADFGGAIAERTTAEKYLSLSRMVAFEVYEAKESSRGVDTRGRIAGLLTKRVRRSLRETIADSPSPITEGGEALVASLSAFCARAAVVSTTDPGSALAATLATLGVARPASLHEWKALLERYQLLADLLQFSISESYFRARAIVSGSAE